MVKIEIVKLLDGEHEILINLVLGVVYEKAVGGEENEWIGLGQIVQFEDVELVGFELFHYFGDIVFNGDVYEV